jgi:folate-binding protein YgfZ
MALNRTGKIQSVLWIVARGDVLLVGSAPGTGPALFAEFERMLVMEDAELLDQSAQLGWAYVVGPQSPGVAWQSGTASAPMDLLGLGGVMAVGPSDELRAALQGTPELDDEAWARLRLERGCVEWGQDFDAADRPHEAGLERRAVDWQKGCYLGQEVVCMQDMRGKVSRRVQRVLVQGTSAAEQRPSGSAIVQSGDGKALGTIKTSAYSELAGGWLGFAMLPVPLPTSDLVLDDATGGRKVTPVENSY